MSDPAEEHDPVPDAINDMRAAAALLETAAGRFRSTGRHHLGDAATELSHAVGAWAHVLEVQHGTEEAPWPGET